MSAFLYPWLVGSQTIFKSIEKRNIQHPSSELAGGDADACDDAKFRPNLLRQLRQQAFFLCRLAFFLI